MCVFVCEVRKKLLKKGGMRGIIEKDRVIQQE